MGTASLGPGEEGWAQPCCPLYAPQEDKSNTDHLLETRAELGLHLSPLYLGLWWEKSWGPQGLCLRSHPGSLRSQDIVPVLQGAPKDRWSPSQGAWWLAVHSPPIPPQTSLEAS